MLDHIRGAWFLAALREGRGLDAASAALVANGLADGSVSDAQAGELEQAASEVDGLRHRHPSRRADALSHKELLAMLQDETPTSELISASSLMPLNLLSHECKKCCRAFEEISARVQTHHCG